MRMRFTDLFLVLILCLIPIVCVLMFHHLNLVETLSRMGSGGFGRSVSAIKIENSVTPSELIGAADAAHDRCAVYYDLSDDSGTVRYIYFNRSYAHLPMINGRFFMHRDFNKGNGYAVVGKNRENEIIVDPTGSRRIRFGGKEYAVIGIMGYEQPTLMDDYLFLNLDSLSEIAAPLVILDNLGSGQSADPSEGFRVSLGEMGIPARLVSGTQVFSESVMPKIISSRWFAAILICCLILLLLVSVQWVNSQIKEVSVRMLVGASPARIAGLIAGRYLLAALLSFIIGAAYCLLLYPAYIGELLLGYAVASCVITVFLFWSACRLAHINIQEALK